MRDAAGQLPHRLQFLGLMQRGFGFFAFGDLNLQPVVDFRQGAGAFADKGFQKFGLLPAFQVARMEAGRHGIEGLRQHAEFRTALGQSGAHIQIALPPPLGGA